jgi:hypothetical protein
MPLSAAATVFSYVYAGFPVLMYDLEGTETLDTATQQAVNECKNTINAIGQVTSGAQAEIIGTARAQYEALSMSGKGYVDNYQVLVDAEAALAAVQAQEQAAAEAAAAEAAAAEAAAQATVQ